MSHHGVISLAHGEGGRLMRQLIREVIQPILGVTDPSHDDAALISPETSSGLAVSTDSYVVSPIEFPGGDIGSLAVHGTVNDLCVSGARPQFVTLSLIIEEGFRLDDLKRILQSAAASARESDVRVVAGDTKVVPRGAADRIFINTTGIGVPDMPAVPGPSNIEIGDEILVSGPIAQHGMAILCAREELGLKPTPVSDCASLLPATRALRDALGDDVRCMRDATRGGVAAVLHEWAEACGHTLSITEDMIPTTPAVRGASELLGIDPLHVANEGTMVVAVRKACGETAVSALKELTRHVGAASIGAVEQRLTAPVVVNRLFGNQHALDDPHGAPMPRIC